MRCRKSESEYIQCRSCGARIYSCSSSEDMVLGSYYNGLKLKYTDPDVFREKCSKLVEKYKTEIKRKEDKYDRECLAEVKKLGL